MSSISLAHSAARRQPTLRARLAVWLELHRSRAALSRLDDHLLADIGLSREYADREASRPFWHA